MGLPWKSSETTLFSKRCVAKPVSRPTHSCENPPRSLLGRTLSLTVFGNVMREAAGGGRAWMFSFTKRVSPDATIDIPLAQIDALYMRSDCDGISVTPQDAQSRLNGASDERL
jgi:hypothetical protein